MKERGSSGGGFHGIGLAEGRDKWRAVVNMGVSLWVLKVLGSSRAAALSVASQGVLSSIQLEFVSMF
jgi:hypothetical protein